jgi:hypothetical protein
LNFYNVANRFRCEFALRKHAKITEKKYSWTFKTSFRNCCCCHCFTSGGTQKYSLYFYYEYRNENIHEDALFQMYFCTPAQKVENPCFKCFRKNSIKFFLFLFLTSTEYKYPCSSYFAALLRCSFIPLNV